MVSSKDVARAAGVSQSTVSRVLNNPEKVNSSNLEKVKVAMKMLNYRPNSIARSLASNKTKTIALISGPLHNPFFVETTMEIVNYAEQKGYKTMVFFANIEDNFSLYENVLSQQVDGIIMSSIFRDDPIYKDLQTLEIPVMMFNRKHNISGHYVETDNIKAGEIAANHLLSLNHERLGFIGGPSYTSTFHGRKVGFLNEYTSRAPSCLDENLIIETNTTEEAVQDAVVEMMSRKHKPTAIFAATDAIALVAIDKLTLLGYDIPGDMSVCGMDNVNLASHQSIQLTTIGHQNKKNLGQLGIEKLIELIETPSKMDVQITLEPLLHERKTTKPHHM